MVDHIHVQNLKKIFFLSIKLRLRVNFLSIRLPFYGIFFCHIYYIYIWQYFYMQKIDLLFCLKNLIFCVFLSQTPLIDSASCSSCVLRMRAIWRAHCGRAAGSAARRLNFGLRFFVISQRIFLAWFRPGGK